MIKNYIDSRGWKYAVLPGLGENTFKARVQKAEKHGAVGWKCVAALPWRKTREAAQADLDKLAAQKGWTEWSGWY